MEVVDERRGGLHRKAGSGHDQHVAIGDLPARAHAGVLVRGLAVEHHVGLHHAAAAGTFGHALGVQQPIEVVFPVAVHAVVLVYAAVQLVHQAVPRHAVQAVDVLGHYAPQLAYALQFVQCPVRRVGPCLWVQHVLPVEFKEAVGVQVEEGRTEHHLRGQIAVFLPIKPVFAAKVGDAAGGADPRAPEEHDPPAPVDDFLQCAHVHPSRTIMTRPGANCKA